MPILGAHRTITAGVSPGTTPSASLVSSGLGPKLALDLGGERLLISLGSNPRAALTAIRDDLDRLVTESKEGT